MHNAIFMFMMVLTGGICCGQRYPMESIQHHIALGTGFGQGQLDWSIAGNSQGHSPNILSELAWDKLQGANLWLCAETPVWRQILLSAHVSITRTFNRRVQDTDYRGDNRTMKVFDESFRSDRGYRLVYGIMGGYRMLGTARFSSIVYLGYRRQLQQLFLSDDKDLESSYRTWWRGPSAQLFFRYRHWILTYQARFSYSQLHYRAEANWNLIETFAHPKSFEHKAKGYSVGLVGEVWLFPDKPLQPSLFMDYNLTQSGRGVDYLYRDDGSTRLTQLNGVRGEMLSAGIGVRYVW